MVASQIFNLMTRVRFPHGPPSLRNNMTLKQILKNVIAGRPIAGTHLSAEDGRTLKADPLYSKLTSDQQKFLENLINKY